MPLDLASAEYRKQLLKVTPGEPVFTLTEDKIQEETKRADLLIIKRRNDYDAFDFEESSDDEQYSDSDD